MQSINQKYASAVYEKVNNACRGVDVPEGFTLQEYSAMAKRIPVLVHHAGLLQALTYVKSRGNISENFLLDQFAAVLGTPIEQLLEDCREQDFQRYRLLTHRAKIALTWFARFAQSGPDVPPENIQTEEGG